MNALLDAFVRTSIQGSAVVLLLWAVLRVAGRRIDPRVRKALWWLVCLRLLVTLLWLTPPSVALLPEAPLEPAHAPSVSVATQVAHGVGGNAIAGLTPATWVSPILVLWVIGALAMVARLLLGSVRLQGLIRRGKPETGELSAETRRLAAAHGLRVPPRVVLSGETSSPFASGWWRPTVVLPQDFASLAAEEREMALAHEIAHLRRADPLLNVVPEIARALLFFLPPVWLACREWATEREAVCDQEALQITGATPKAYREMLLKVASYDLRPARMPALGATAEFGLLRRRMERLGKTAGFSFLMSASTLALATPALVPWQVSARAAKGEVALANPGFEQGVENEVVGWTKGPRLDGVRYVWDHEVSHSGHASLSIQKRVDRYFPIAEWVQTIPVPPGSKTIELSAWVRSERMYKAVLDVQFVTDEGIGAHEWAAYIGAEKDGDPPADHDWKRLGGTVEIPPNTQEINLALQDYGPGKVWFDDIKARFSKEMPREVKKEITR